jgi:hypothetical protein
MGIRVLDARRLPAGAAVSSRRSCRQIVGDPAPDPCGQIVVNLAEIAPEDRLEPFWLGP